MIAIFIHNMDFLCGWLHGYDSYICALVNDFYLYLTNYCNSQYCGIGDPIHSPPRKVNINNQHIGTVLEILVEQFVSAVFESACLLLYHMKHYRITS